MCVTAGRDSGGENLLDFAIVESLDDDDNGEKPRLPCKVSKHAFLSVTEQQDTFRYIVDLPGNGWSSRFMQLLKLDSVIVKAKDKYTGFCEALSEPGVHYKTFDVDAPDGSPTSLLSVLRGLRDDDAGARQTISASNEFVHDYCSEEAQMCYWKVLLEEYAKVLTFVPDRAHPLAVPVHYPPYQATLGEFLVGATALALFTCACCFCDIILANVLKYRSSSNCRPRILASSMV